MADLPTESLSLFASDGQCQHPNNNNSKRNIKISIDEDKNHHPAVRRQSSFLNFLRRIVSALASLHPSHSSTAANQPVSSVPSWSSSSLWLLSLLSIAYSGYLNELRRQRLLTSKPMIYHQKSHILEENDDNNESADVTIESEREKRALITAELIVRRMPSLRREVRPSLFFGTSSVLNSLMGYLKFGPQKRAEKLAASFREIMTMPQDGGQIAIDWELPSSNNTATITKDHILKGSIQTSVVIIVHGVNNDASFGYIRSAMRLCTDRGWVAAGLNMRGCGGVDMATPRGYNGAYTGDIRCVVNKIAARLAPDNYIFLVGNSLGANLVVKYLGEEGLSRTLLRCVAGGVSLGNPLHINSRNLLFPWNYILGLGIKKMLLFQRKSILSTPGLVRDSFYKALVAPTLGEIDHILAPHYLRNESRPPYATSFVGYADGEEYWNDASSYHYIKHMSIPLLQISALDDFLVRYNVLGKMAECLVNPNVIIAKTKSGGHLGWNEGTGMMSVLFGASWADKATVEFIDVVLQLKRKQQQQQQQHDEKEKKIEYDKECSNDSTQLTLQSRL